MSCVLHLVQIFLRLNLWWDNFWRRKKSRIDMADVYPELYHFQCRELRAGCSSEVFFSKATPLYSAVLANGKSGHLYLETIRMQLFYLHWNNKDVYITHKTQYKITPAYVLCKPVGFEDTGKTKVTLPYPYYPWFCFLIFQSASVNHGLKKNF